MTPCPGCGAPTHAGACGRDARRITLHLEQQWALQALHDARRDAHLMAALLLAALDT